MSNGSNTATVIVFFFIKLNPALICSDLSCVSLCVCVLFWRCYYFYSLQRVDCKSAGFYLCVLYVKYIHHKMVYCGHFSSLSLFFTLEENHF